VTYQPRDGDGSLFDNDRKQSSQHPDMTGQILIGGVEYWISAWRKSSRDGTKHFLSLSARPKVAKAPPAPKAAPTEVEDFDDKLPF